jgi:signal peptidase II
MALQLKPRPLYLRFSRLPLVLMCATVVCDQATKWWVVSAWPHVGHHLTVIPHFFTLVHFRNPGAAWGIFSQYPLVLTVLSFAVLCAAVVWFPKLAEGVPIRALARGVILGGIAGNLIDRLFRREVVDFLLFYWRSYQWPAFNVADTAISCGVVVFILSSFLHAHEQAEQQPTQEPA